VATARLEPRGVPIGRLVAVLVLVVIAALYVEPVQKYLRVSHDLTAQQARVAALERREAALATRRAELGTRPALVQLARACGWIFPGEVAVVVRGLPPAARPRCG
jgi:hypothetical protein